MQDGGWMIKDLEGTQDLGCRCRMQDRKLGMQKQDRI